MNEGLRRDLERLEHLAFRRAEACGGLLKRFYRLPTKTHSHSAYTMMGRLREWLLSPFTLWPVDFCGLADHLLSRLEANRRVDTDVELLMALLNDAPGPEEQQAIAEHEHQVQAGNYEAFIDAQPKFTQREEELFENPAFQEDWAQLKAHFKMARYRDRKGIIRRRLAHERSFHPSDWEFLWNLDKDRFPIVFDAFCHRWILYGMEGERPLLQKFSVNVTPFGTMIFIPHYWSFDGRRDLKWGAVNRLHRARGVQRQGEKLGRNERERLREAKVVKDLWGEALAAGCKGEARYQFVIQRMGWRADTDASRVKRLLKTGR